MKTAPIVTVTIAAVLLAGAARSQEPSPSALVAHYLDERQGLGLEAAIARAIAGEPSLRAIRSDIDAARGESQQARLRPNPTVTFERRDEPAGTDSLTTIGVQWPLDLFRRPGRLQVAEREVEAVRFTVADRERGLAADVRLQYGVAAAAVRDLGVADDLVAAAQRQFEVLRARVDAGASPPLERDLIEVELRRLQAAQLAAAGRADVAVIELKRLLGQPPDQPLLLRDTLEALVSAPDSSIAVRATSLTRPDVRQAEARVTVAEARIDQAHREGRIDVSLYASYMRMDQGYPQLGIGATGTPERVRGRFNYVAAGAMVMLPLFNRNQGQVAAAQAERAGAEARREATELAARSEVAAAQARDERAQTALELYTRGVRTLARKNLDVVRQTFDLGQTTVFEVLAEQRRYLEIERDYTLTLREVWDARAALRRALGEAK